MRFRLVLLFAVVFICFALPHGNAEVINENRSIVSFETTDQQQIQMHWKKDDGDLFKNLGSLKDSLEENGCTVLMACNGGMYMENRTPLGLYIEKGKTHRKLNTRKNATGNFYLAPNGVFWVEENGTAHISETLVFRDDKAYFATQSGPILLVDGVFNSHLTKGSTNLNIRNGVGILPNGNALFAISKDPVNFYDFASFFKEKGCKNALYLDGFVSRMYCPDSDYEQRGGNFGVMISVVER